MRLPTPPEPAMLYLDAGFQATRCHNETQLIEYGRQCALAMREACAEVGERMDPLQDGAMRDEIMNVEIEE